MRNKTGTAFPHSHLLGLLFLDGRNVQPNGTPTKQERDDLLKQQDAAHHACTHTLDTGSYFGNNKQTYVRYESCI